MNVRTRVATLSTAVILSLSASAALADTFSVGYEAAGIQVPLTTTHYTDFGTSAGFPTSYTTNFNGSSITGTYTNTTPGGGQITLYGADLYGGAGGSGAYLATQYEQQTTLQLSAQVRYFGLWFSALDSGNVLKFYDNGSLVYTFTAPDYVASVGPCTGAPNAYCGNPNNGLDPLEQFAYINLTDLTGTFNQVVFQQVDGQHYGRFEADNNAIEQVVPGSTPEPSSLILLGTGLIGMAGAVRRRFVK